MPILVEIVTPERRIFSEEVEMVTLPGVAGQMGVLRGHQPLLSTLDIGEIVLHRRTGDNEYIAVHGGVVEVRPNKVTILADVAEDAESIDLQRAEAARRRAQEMIESREAGKYDPAAVAALRRSNLRLKVAQRRRPRRGPQFQGDAEAA
jgi:F-type H+-transporting ATPase subunit epsilon